jgi:hypothetical protein
MPSHARIRAYLVHRREPDLVTQAALQPRRWCLRGSLPLPRNLYGRLLPLSVAITTRSPVTLSSPVSIIPDFKLGNIDRISRIRMAGSSVVAWGEVLLGQQRGKGGTARTSERASTLRHE